MKKKHLSLTLYLLGGLLIVCFGFLIWLYTGSQSSTKARFFEALHLPIAKVGSSFVDINQLNTRITLSDKLGINKNQRRAVLNTLLNDYKAEIIAKKHGISISASQLQAEYASVINQSGRSQAEFEELIKEQYGLSPSEFSDVVIGPTAVKAGIATWYNNNLNQKQRSSLEQIQSRLSKGDRFADLAKQYSDDQSSSRTGGELGPQPENALLPEIATALKSLPINTPKIVASRNGLHLIELLHTSNDAEHGSTFEARQIFLKNSGFDTWYTSQLEETKSTVFIKI